MEESTFESVELQKAVQWTELWPAIETAQFAHFIVHDTPDNDADAEAIETFVARFSACAETWEETLTTNKAIILQGMETHLRALESKGLFVHWGTVTRDFSAPDGDVRSIPVAVVTIDRTSVDSATVVIPVDLDLDEDSEQDPIDY